VLCGILAFSARRLAASELTLVHHAPLLERDLLVGQVLAPLLTLLDDLDDVFIVIVHL